MTVTIYFDGDPAQDFVRLQQGRAVDASHLLALRVRHKLLKDAAVQAALEVARLLHTQEGSPVRQLVRLDSRGGLPLPVSALCSRGASDIGTSLVGLARVSQTAEQGKEPAWLASVVTAAFQALKKDAPALLDCGKVVTPMANNGTKGAATMLIGIGTVLAYRMSVLGHATPTEDDLSRLVQSAKATLDEAVSGNLSGPRKRELLGRFAKEFLADVAGDKHRDLPVGLLRVLSASAFGVAPLPKEKKPKAAKKAGEQKVEGSAAGAAEPTTGAPEADAA